MAKVKAKKENTFEVKAVVYSRGHTEHEPAMTCNLYVNNKMAASVYDDSCEAGYQITEVNKELFKIFDDHVKALPPVDVEYMYGDGKEHFMDESLDTVIGDLITKYEFDKNERAMVKRAKTNVLFRLDAKTYGDHEYEYVKAPYSDAVVGFLTKKYGHEITIYNVHGKWPTKATKAS